MSQIKGKNTGLEKIFRASVSGLDIRGYRLNAKITGKPDMYFSKNKIAVFIDGCFWHGCPRCYARPATNKKYWSDKIIKNKTRDKTVTGGLRKEGIRVVRFWGHEINKNPVRCAKKLQKIIEQYK